MTAEAVLSKEKPQHITSKVQLMKTVIF